MLSRSSQPQKVLPDLQFGLHMVLLSKVGVQEAMGSGSGLDNAIHYQLHQNVHKRVRCAGGENSLTGRLRQCLARLPDLERGVTRMLHCTASPSELALTLRAFSTLAADLGIQVYISVLFALEQLPSGGAAFLVKQA